MPIRREMIKNKQKQDTKPKIKRPASAYILFSKDIRSILIKENPTLQSKEIVKLIGERWKQLPSNEKEKYIQKYTKAKQEYEMLIKEQSHS